MVLTLLFAERLIYGDARGVLAGQHRLLRSRLGCVRRCVRVRASFVWSLEKANESILMARFEVLRYYPQASAATR